MKQEPRIESANAFSKEEIRNFIQSRKIKPEDLHLIEQLASFPQNLIIGEFHNLFNTYKDRSGEELKKLIETTLDQDKVALYKIVFEFYNKYGWAASFSLIRVLEGEI